MFPAACNGFAITKLIPPVPQAVYHKNGESEKVVFPFSPFFCILSDLVSEPRAGKDRIQYSVVNKPKCTPTLGTMHTPVQATRLLASELNLSTFFGTRRERIATEARPRGTLLQVLQAKGQASA